MNRKKLNIILSMLIFGTIGVVRRYIPFPSSIVALARAAIGLVFLLCVKAVKREKIDFAAIKRNFWPLLISGAMLAFNWVMLFEAYNMTTVSVATVCYYMAPVFVIFLSPILFHEGYSNKNFICAGFALFGMVLVSGVIKTGFVGVGGIIFALIAAAMYATIVILNRTVKGLSGIDRTIFQFAVSVVCMIPYVLLTEKGADLTAGGLVWLMLIVAGIVHTGIAYVLYFGSVADVPAQTAAILSYLDPVTAVILSVTLLAEPMDTAAVIGAVIALGAMVISEISFRKKRA